MSNLITRITELRELHNVTQGERSYFVGVRMRDIIKTNWRGAEDMQRQTKGLYESATQYLGSKARRKTLGNYIAMRKAKAMQYVSTQFTAPDDASFIAIQAFVNEVFHQGWIVRNAVLPHMNRSFENLSEGEWERVDVLALHPYQNGKQDVDGMYSMYRDLEYGLEELSRLHFLHLSKDDPKQVAYYPSLQHAINDRVVRTSMGKYLTKYAAFFKQPEHVIKSIAEAHHSNIAARDGWSLEFIEHDDRKGWVAIYASDEIDSCMQNESAVKVYAHEKSVLRLAYIDSAGTAIARAIVRDDDKKGYIRIYPSPDGTTEGRFLLDSLRAAGYGTQTNLDGALLDCIEGNGGYVCPYLDYGNGGSQTVSVEYIDGKNYLVCGGGDLQADNTSGYCEGGYACSCDECGEGMSEDDSTWVSHDELTLCESCLRDNYVYAMGRQYKDWYREDECVEVNGDWYWTDTAEYHDIYQCDDTDEWFKSDDMMFFDEGAVCVDSAVKVDHPHDGNDYVHPDYVSTLSDGTTCHDDDVDEYEPDQDADDDDEEEAVAPVQEAIEAEVAPDDEAKKPAPTICITLPHEYKVGDVVRIVDGYHYNYFSLGDVGRLDSFDGRHWWVDFNGFNNAYVRGNGRWCVAENAIALVDNTTIVEMSHV